MRKEKHAAKKSLTQRTNSHILTKRTVDENEFFKCPKFIRNPNITTMAIFNFQVMLYSLSIIFCFLFPQTHSLYFNLKNIGRQHGSLNITAFRDATISSSGLQLTTAEKSGDLLQKAGKATYNDRLHLWDNTTGKLADFETHFVFVIDSDGSESFADGLTFFLADPTGSDITTGGAMGLPINPTTIAPTSRFVAVEFDTFYNDWDPSNISPATHIGIDVNSINSSVTAPWYCNVPDGIENEAWIRYDSSSHNLSVVFTGSTNTTRVKDTIHLIIDLRKYLPEKVTFGFTAATGGSYEKHTVISWEFSSSFQVDPRPKKLPFGALVGIVVGSVVLVGGFGWVGFGLWKRSRENRKDKSEVELPTRNFPYGELPRATDEDGPKLADRRSVYRGFLSELSSYIKSDAH